jgi:coenzyme F420-reducing hydrogenase beta subunit
MIVEKIKPTCYTNYIIKNEDSMSDFTIEVLEKDKCTGCSACYNVCPTGAITMEDNSEGFLYPKINKTKCISCGLCKEKCPQINVLSLEKSNPYVTIADNQLRKKSSSGAMFSLLAKHILQLGGYVCGASWNKTRVQHILINDEEDLDLIRKSKYLQSDINDVYRKIKDLLIKNYYVMFSGCPCQVAGLKKFLGDDYEKLLLVDLVCHGVPSPGLFQKYLEEKSNGKEIIKIDFRDKERGWGTHIKIVFQDKSEYYNSCFDDEWYKGFLGGYITRKSCASCRYSDIDRIGDISLGDFWGVSKINPAYDDNLGTGLTLINTTKGELFFNSVKDSLMTCEKVDKNSVIEIAKKHNGQLLAPKKNDYARKRFFELIKSRSYIDSVNCVEKNVFDIGIVGWWYNDNYGGTLSYFALYKTLTDMGKSVLMIERSSYDEKYVPKFDTVPRKFAQKHYYISKIYHPYKLGILNQHCNAFISGSDQLFNYYLWNYSGPEYFLDFSDPKKNIISYASSFGDSYQAPEEHTMNIAYYLNRFNSLSAREDYAVEIFKDVFNLDSKHVVDPVFLCDINHYYRIADEAKEIDTHYNYLVSFILDPSKDKRELILKLSQELNLKYNILTDLQNVEEKVKQFALDNVLENICIEGWVKYYRDAQFILTDSFHGTCFAIIFKKQFISIANKQRGIKRFSSLLSTFGLMDRLILEDELNNTEKILNILSTQIDYDKIDMKMKDFISDSYHWLYNAINNPPSKANRVFNILESKINRANNIITDLQNKVSKLEKIINEKLYKDVNGNQ